MHSGTMTFLFATGEIAQELWHFHAASAADAMKGLRQVAQVRLALLAANVRIVRLSVPTEPIQKVDWKGTGGEFTWPRDAVVWRDDGKATRRRLRGVPKEVFSHTGMTPAGQRAFQSLSQALKQCNCVLDPKAEPPETISKVVPMYATVLSARAVKKPTKKKLVALLGVEEGQKAWDGLKKQRTPATATP